MKNCPKQIRTVDLQDEIQCTLYIKDVNVKQIIMKQHSEIMNHLEALLTLKELADLDRMEMQEPVGLGLTKDQRQLLTSHRVATLIARRGLYDCHEGVTEIADPYRDLLMDGLEHRAKALMSDARDLLEVKPFTAKIHREIIHIICLDVSFLIREMLEIDGCSTVAFNLFQQSEKLRIDAYHWATSTFELYHYEEEEYGHLYLARDGVPAKAFFISELMFYNMYEGFGQVTQSDVITSFDVSFSTSETILREARKLCYSMSFGKIVFLQLEAA